MKNFASLVFSFCFTTSMVYCVEPDNTEVHNITVFSTEADLSNVWESLSHSSVGDPLRIFSEEIKKRSGGIVIRNQNTVIIPITTLVLIDFLDLSRNPISEFIGPKFTTKEEIEDLCVDLLAFEKMDYDGKMESKLNDYAIFALDEKEKLGFAGLYSVSNPDTTTGWSEVHFLLKKSYRGRKLGREVVEAIDKLVRDLIGKRTKIIRYRETKESIRLCLPQYGIKTQMEGVSEAYNEDSEVTFSGLQGWIHEDNIASIKLYEKCGWSKVSEETKKDLSGNDKKFYLFRRQ